MKQAKPLTRRYKEILSKNGYDWREYSLYQEWETKIIFIHKPTGAFKGIDKKISSDNGNLKIVGNCIDVVSDYSYLTRKLFSLVPDKDLLFTAFLTGISEDGEKFKSETMPAFIKCQDDFLKIFDTEKTLSKATADSIIEILKHLTEEKDENKEIDN